VAESQVVVCHTPLRAKAAEFQSKRVLIIGRPQCVDVARSYGFTKAVGPGRIHAEHPHIFPSEEEIASEEEIRQAQLSQEPIGAY
jgi:ribonucleotide monophosphatase NagD (HAD superfamily)